MASAQFKHIVTAAVVTVWISVPLPGAAQDGQLDGLFDRLRDADPETYGQIERELQTELGKSGSAAMDLLARRGREALEQREAEAALEHFTALVDHAPDFAAGYAGRAQAYYLLGRHGPALDDLRQVLVIEPRHYEAMAGIAAMLEAIGEDQAALDAYRAAAEVHPNEPTIQGAIARLAPRVGGIDI